MQIRTTVRYNPIACRLAAVKETKDKVSLKMLENRNHICILLVGIRSVQQFWKV